MNARLLICFLLFTATRMSAQQVVPDSIYDQLNKTSNDTLKLFLLDKIAGSYEENNWDSALYYEAKILPLAKEIHFSILEANIHDQLGYIHTHRGNFSQALADLLTGIEIIQDPGSDKNPDDGKINWYFNYFGTKQFADIRSQTLGWLHLHLGHLYGSVGNYRDQVNQYFICEKYWHESVSLTYIFMNLGGAYVNMNKLDSALFYETKAYQVANPAEFSYYFKLLKILGVIYTDLGNFTLAKKYFYQDVATDHSSNKNEIYSSMSLMYIRMGIRDSALYFANLGNQLAIVSKSPEDIIYARNALAQIYDSLQLPDSA